MSSSIQGKIRITRKSDCIKEVLESDSTAFSLRGSGFQCVNCKERYYLIDKKGDNNNNLFCINCGHLTPIRTIKHSRGIAAPSIQQQTAILTSLMLPCISILLLLLSITLFRCLR